MKRLLVSGIMIFVLMFASVGLINGRGSNLFEPKAFTSRAEAVVILSRMYGKE